MVSKTQWPELVGMTGEQAVKIIKQETGKNKRGLDVFINVSSRFSKCYDGS